MTTCLIKSEVPITFKDHPNTLSAVFYTDISLCNLNCYKCHNKASKCKSLEFITYDELSDKINKYKMLGVELIIICGGEPTLVDYDMLSKTLTFIKDYDLNIRLDTNGQRPNIVNKLINDKLIDGIALDIKIPLTVLKKHYSKILFSRDYKSGDDELISEYQKNVITTLDMISKSNLKYNLLRTVKYPLFDNEDICLISKYVKQYNILHQVNDFVDID